MTSGAAERGFGIWFANYRDALVDPDATWTVRGADLASIATNTPYEGMELPGRVVHTLLRGKFTVHNGKVAS